MKVEIMIFLATLLIIESQAVNLENVALVPCPLDKGYGRCTRRQHCLDQTTTRTCTSFCIYNKDDTKNNAVCCPTSKISLVPTSSTDTSKMPILFPTDIANQQNRTVADNEQVDYVQSGVGTGMAWRDRKCKYFNASRPAALCFAEGAVLPAGGFEVRKGQYQWKVPLFRKGMFDVSYRCGGSLIHPNFVLTAAHCIDSLNPQDYFVRIGAHNLSNPGDDIQSEEVQVQKIVRHPSFSMPYNDIAILQINTPTIEVIPACLPRDTLTEEETDRKSLKMVGWGIAQVGKDALIATHSSVPLLIHTPVRNTAECSKLYEEAQTGDFFSKGIPSSQFICAGNENQGVDACQFDSGSGLFLDDYSSRFMQGVIVGVVSAGSSKCATKLPTLYTRVTTHLPWIKEIIGPYPIVQDPDRKYN